MQNKISVIIPIYNVERYIDKCIKSILFQTYTNLEIIIVDDGSTDNSKRIVNGYMAQDARIKVIHTEKNGSAKARKIGLNAATGDYLIFVDGDDYINENLCEKMLQQIMEKNVDFVHANYIENGCKKVNAVRENVTYNEKDMSAELRLELIRQSVLDNNMYRKSECANLILPNLWAKIFKIDFIRECYNRIPDGQDLGEDLICLCHMLMKCRSMALITDAFYNYNLRDDSISHKCDLKKFGQCAGLYNAMETLFKEYGCWNIVSQNVDDYCESTIVFFLRKCETKHFHINIYYWENIAKLKSKRVVIYGAGKVGKDYYEQFCRYNNINIVDWIDKEYKNKTNDYYEIHGLNRLCDFDKNKYDVVVVAVLDEAVAAEINKELIRMGIEEKKILWEKPQLNRIITM